MTGTVGILNVGAGDTKLSFDPNNPAERIRAARIVKDMLRRGYALLVEVPAAKPGDERSYRRVHEFDEDTCEYIIADLDPEIAARADAEEGDGVTQDPAGQGAPAGTDAQPRKPARARIVKRRIGADTTSAVAVARTAGG